MKDIVEGIAKAHNIKSSFSYYTRTNMTTNSADQVDAAMAAARTVVGKDMVDGKLFGYNMGSVGELNDKMKDDVISLDKH